jgi:hypothetical protein
MKNLQKFITKILIGGYTFEIGKRYIHIPKVSPFFIISMVFIGLFNNSYINIIGYILLIMAFIGFFYPKK